MKSAKGVTLTVPIKSETEPYLVQVGDVITSPKFAYGTFEIESKKGKNEMGLNKSRVIVDGKTKRYQVNYVSGYNPNTGAQIMAVRDIGAYEEQRGREEFVVVEARLAGGSDGRDYWPDGWFVKASRLKPNTGDDWNNHYDPDGQTIEFYQTGSFNCMVAPEDVKVVRKMKKVVTFVEADEV